MPRIGTCLGAGLAVALTACAPPPVSSSEGPSTSASPSDAGALGTSGRGPCAPCTDAADCGGPNDLCLVAPAGGRFCTTDCRRQACPYGYECVPMASGAMQCVPASGACGGSTAGPNGDVSGGDVELPPFEPGPSDEGCGMSQPEAAVFALVDEARRDAGLASYDCHSGLTEVARAHSQAMCDLGFFSHFDPSGRAPWDRVREAGLSARGTAENIAGGQSSPESVHASWMSSAGHRRNILLPDYQHVGIGYVSCGGGWGHYWTEVFTKGLGQ